MKKLFSYVLALTLLVSTMSVAFAAPADVKDDEQKQAVDVLMALGVVNGYEDGTYKPEKTVTRAEMAKLIVVALGFEQLAKADNSQFSDMADHWAKGYVQVCTGLGIIKGYPDGTFGPNKTVTYAEAATMLVRALGWTDEAIKGTWPTNYTSKAFSLKLFKDVQYSAGGANRGDIAELLYNTLDKGIGTINQNGKYVVPTVNNTTVPEDTMFERLGVETEDDKVITGDEATLVNLRKHVGVYSKVFKQDSGDERLVLATPASKVLVGKFNDTYTKFTTDDKTTYNVASLPLSSTFRTQVFYNGERVGEVEQITGDGGALDTYTHADEILPAVAKGIGTGKVKISAKVDGLRIENLYAISKWHVSRADLFKNSDAKKITKDKELEGASFVQTGDNKIDLNSFELEGVDKLEDIEKDDVVYVYYASSSPRTIRKVVVGTKTLEDVKLDKRTAGTNAKYFIDGKKYEDAGFMNDNGDVQADQKVNVKFDAFGKVYEIKGTEVTTKYAVVLETAPANGSGLGATPAKVKLFLADGTNKIFEVDPAKVSDTDVIDNDGSNWHVSSKTLVSYGVDESNGKIVDMNLVQNQNAGSDTSDVTADVSSSGVYNGKLITADTVVFEYSGETSGGQQATEEADASKYAVVKYSEMFGDDNVVSRYQVDGSKIKAMVANTSSTTGVYGFIIDAYSVGNNKWEIKSLGKDGETTLKTVTGASAAPGVRVDDLNLYEYAFSGDKVRDYVLVVDGTPQHAHITTVSIDNDTEASVTDDNKVLTIGNDSYTLSDKVYVARKDKDNDADVKAISLSELVDLIEENAIQSDNGGGSVEAPFGLQLIDLDNTKGADVDVIRVRTNK